MDTRRDFIRKAAMLSVSTGSSFIFPDAIKRALAINPVPGSTYMDAEHVVILMQENRSFEHCFGTLKGVRGFNDPRAITLPGGNPVWLQTDSGGRTFLPFHLDIKDTKSVWMGALPHARASQVDASNNGKHNKWIDAKKSRNQQYRHIPLTMGYYYYTRNDLPFNYALADAFTICDQHFCSAMTSTYPNRLFLWSGKIRKEETGNSKACIRNEDLSFGGALWPAFPERLEDNDISWKVYQNDISCGGGYQDGEKAWLANFGCNTLEYFSQFNVKFSKRFLGSLENQLVNLPEEISELESQLAKTDINSQEYSKLQQEIQSKKTVLNDAKSGLEKWNKENYKKLSEREKNLFLKAFVNNAADTDFNKLTTLKFDRDGEDYQVTVPQGDVLFQFRQDVNEGKLPVVSWLVPPQNFSEHPSVPFYGNWYVSEILDILTKNPEVWKKTIFIVTYDENDGFFDHIPPFTAPNPQLKNQGKCSPSIDSSVEFIQRDDEIGHGTPKNQARTGPVGLGFRVPLIVASPWSRGGRVCSQIFDHTSTLQFLEKFLSYKFGKKIMEPNIGSWRRAVCGDLTSIFRPFGMEEDKLPFIHKDEHIENIYLARFKEVPAGYHQLSDAEIKKAIDDVYTLPDMPVQEPGVKPSCALPYELYATGTLNKSKKLFEIVFAAGNSVFGTKSSGAPFKVYDLLKKEGHDDTNDSNNRSYAVIAGDKISDAWDLINSDNEAYHLRVYGPNGFYREFAGGIDDPDLKFELTYEQSLISGKPSGNIILEIENAGVKSDFVLKLIHHGFKKKIRGEKIIKLRSGKMNESLRIGLKDSRNWYDFSIELSGYKKFKRRFSGCVETGTDSYTDPVMGRII